MVVKADLTKEQEDDIALFATSMITEGYKAPHIDSKGFSILAYNQGTRNEGFYNKLSYMNKDYNKVNEINGNKWTFDCASFAAYVYYHCLGVNTTYLSNNSPYVVSKFVEETSRGNTFYFVMQNVNTSSMDYSKLKKGDLIIFVGSHIMVYVGDGKIAHFSSSAINRGTNLGAEVTDLKIKYPDHKASIIRVKDGVVKTNVKANMKITWPDTNKVQDFNEFKEKDNLPKVDLTVNRENNKVIINISLSDDKGLTGYYISNRKETPNSWHSISNTKTYSTTFEPTNNETYYCYVKDSINQISYSTIEINDLDKDKPVINNVIYKYIKDTDTFNIEVKATDKNKILYALDSNNYQDSNKFNKISKGNHKILVKDTSDNVSEYTFELTTELIPTINLNYDKNYSKVVTINISGVDTIGINGYNVTRTSDEPKSFLNYSDNLTYNILTNGDYYFWVRNTRGTVNYQKITINNIDNSPPTISKVDIKRKSGYFNVVIDAIDNECGIGGYSLDGNIYQTENTFSDAKTIYNKVYVKDKCNNIGTYDIDINSIPDEDNMVTTILLIAIIIVILLLIVFNIKGIKKKR